jgi:hypothetical protein
MSRHSRGTLPSGKATWLEDIDLSRSLENLLVGIILFVGRYPTTWFYLLFRTNKLPHELIYDPSYRSKVQLAFTRPISFLVVSGFIYLSFILTGFGTFIPAEAAIESLRPLIEKMPTAVDELTFESMAKFMAPFVLEVALFALATQIVCRTMRIHSSYKVQLNIGCYIVGMVAVLLNLTYLAEVRAWDLVFSEGNAWINSVPLLLVAALLFGLLGLCAYRYVALTRKAIVRSWSVTSLVCVASIATFYVMNAAIIAALAPVLEKLK